MTVRVGITSACISLFSQQHQRLRAKCNYLFTVKCVAVGIIVAIIDSPIFLDCRLAIYVDIFPDYLMKL